MMATPRHGIELFVLAPGFYLQEPRGLISQFHRSRVSTDPLLWVDLDSNLALSVSLGTWIATIILPICTFVCPSVQMKSVVDVLVDPNNGLKVTERPKALADRMVDLWGMISEVSENLPPATLRWRIQNWLAAGQGRVERGLGDMKVTD